MSRLTYGLAIAAAAALLGVGYVDRSTDQGRGAQRSRFKKRPTIKPTSEGLRPGKQFRLKGVRP